ncbi:AraC family transcriptional regulator [Formicincola oecophyllae]|uniref:AraC family transcriptional regulator n=1 Tax=Formicincola oecophyllae TaxID=2558361 RepID=A0A4Y6U9U5_9PROT|nr:AraC family transcriptional regulator [Formicincola oecophyllae]QDH13207.1 AraC family transcriptional regulator [Formicincola oecophyllae]
MATPPFATEWTFWRPGPTLRLRDVKHGNALVHDVNRFQGAPPALPAHFHDEDQVTIVLKGAIQFRLLGENGPETCLLRAGERLLIPAGVPHRTLSPQTAELLPHHAPAHFPFQGAPPPFAGLEQAGDASSGPALICMSFFIARPAQAAHQEGIATDLIQTIVQEGLVGPLDAARLWGGRSLQALNVTEAARHAGMSREGWSRKFRRLHGLPPQRFELLVRLNKARALLRAGHKPAAVAAACGFADQSHLGRHFRDCFGVTPGHYRACMPYPAATFPTFF